MYYLVRKLHLAAGKELPLQVVEVVNGVVVAFFPFDVERPSMLWVEEACFSFSPAARSRDEVVKAVTMCGDSAQPLYLYSCDEGFCRLM